MVSTMAHSPVTATLLTIVVVAWQSTPILARDCYECHDKMTCEQPLEKMDTTFCPQNGVCAVVNVLVEREGMGLYPSIQRDCVVKLEDIRGCISGTSYVRDYLGAFTAVGTVMGGIGTACFCDDHLCNSFGDFGPPEHCPDGYSSYKGSCYKFHDSPTDFSKARLVCQEEGGDLASITSRNENRFMEYLAHGQKSWIGGVRTEGGSTTFSWLRGDPWAYENWRKEGDLLRGPEPNNWLGNEDCVEMNFVNDGMWNDQVCSRQCPFICQTAPTGA